MFTMPEWLDGGTHAGRPAATAVAHGAIYSCTDHSKIYQSDGATWSDWATFSSPGALDLSSLTIERRIQGVTDYVAAYDGSASDERGFPVGALARGRQHSITGSECFLGDIGTPATAALFDSGVAFVFSGASAGVSNATAANTHPGIVSLDTGTATNGRSGLASNGNVVALGAGKLRFTCIALIPTLSDGTNTFSINMGLGNAMGGTSQTDGVTFRYSHSVNSGKWQAVTAASSVETASDTGITADTGWHTFEFEINAAGTSIEFFIDGVSVATITTNIPSATMRLIPANIVKSAGGTSRSFRVDLYNYSIELTTAR